MTDDKTMTVERFDPEISCGPPCVGVMEPAPAGEYVRYADYQAALQARDAEVAQAYAAVESKAGWEWKKRAEQAELWAAALEGALREVIAACHENEALFVELTADGRLDCRTPMANAMCERFTAVQEATSSARALLESGSETK